MTNRWLTGAVERRWPMWLGALLVAAVAGAFAAPAALGQAPTGRPATTPSRAVPPVRSCGSLTGLALHDTTVTSATTVAATGTVPEYCDVQLTVNNPPSADAVHVGVFLPTTTWNARFIGTGGGGWVSGVPSEPCGQDPPPGGAFDPCALQDGYATANTDGGTQDVNFNDASFAVNPDGSLNWQLIDDFGYLGIHEMTTTAKALIAAYYGQGPKYSYFFGLSKGGQQAIMEAQRFPSDYNGIMAGSPAVSWTKFIPADLWPQLVMNWAHDLIPHSKFTAADNAATAACDGLDGAKDGIISNWQACHFDALSLVGTATPNGPITTTDADIINKIWQGPRGPNGEFLWYGLLPGASFGLAGTVTAPDGTLTPAPFAISVSYFQNFLAQNPNFNWQTMTYDEFVQYFHKSVSEFGHALATDDPNLTAFRDAGGKLVITEGTYDPLVFPQGVVAYYDRVAQTMGGLKRTDQFARFFLAPGEGHGTSGAGPAPAGNAAAVPIDGGALAAVVAWVEHHKAPSELLGVTNPEGGQLNSNGNVVMTRPICLYPQVARYKGHGSTNDAGSFVCSASFKSGAAGRLRRQPR